MQVILFGVHDHREGSFNMMTDVATQRTRLQVRLAELQDRALHVAHSLSEPVSGDSADRAIEREDDDALEGEGVMIMGEIQCIRAALSRIDAGNYGQCCACGQTISAARLAALPEAALCIGCAESAERH
jgi:DnaK suppressor protein